LGLDFERAQVGDRYVLEQLKQKQWLLGGEGSGHLLCLDHHTTGDGTIAALQVLAAMRQKKQSLAQLLSAVTIFPQVLINIRIPANYHWQDDAQLQAKITSTESALGQRGRVLIRPSGTEPVLRIMVEAQDAALAQSSAEQIAAVVPKEA
jgi:phosphoglucosamine mutase